MLGIARTVHVSRTMGRTLVPISLRMCLPLTLCMILLGIYCSQKLNNVHVLPITRNFHAKFDHAFPQKLLALLVGCGCEQRRPQTWTP